MYAVFWKRVLDVILSFLALIVLSPLLLVLTGIGAIAMRGNPFFTQQRPGRMDAKTGEERIFRLYKFRTMDNRRDAKGDLLPDEVRLNGYGRFLRKTSLDELPELLNILCGSMSVIGPRPLLVQYLPLYSERQRLRHTVRPGLTGYAQAHGRNAVSWEERFEMDVWYTENISLLLDIKVLFATVKAVLKRDGISSDTCATMEPFEGTKQEATL